MSNQNFIDYVKICGRSGNGGAGSHSFFRENLNVWAFNVTALEPFFDGEQCEVFNKTPKEFKSFFKSIFKDEIKFSTKNKKI